MAFYPVVSPCYSSSPLQHIDILSSVGEPRLYVEIMPSESRRPRTAVVALTSAKGVSPAGLAVAQSSATLGCYGLDLRNGGASRTA